MMCLIPYFCSWLSNVKILGPIIDNYIKAQDWVFLLDRLWNCNMKHGVSCRENDILENQAFSKSYYTTELGVLNIPLQHLLPSMNIHLTDTIQTISLSSVCVSVLHHRVWVSQVQILWLSAIRHSLFIIALETFYAVVLVCTDRWYRKDVNLISSGHSFWVRVLQTEAMILICPVSGSAWDVTALKCSWLGSQSSIWWWPRSAYSNDSPGPLHYGQ